MSRVGTPLELREWSYNRIFFFLSKKLIQWPNSLPGSLRFSHPLFCVSDDTVSVIENHHLGYLLLSIIEAIKHEQIKIKFNSTK